MKLLLVLVLILMSHTSFGQRAKVNVDGKTFYGRATEITPPDVDRMPKFFTEVITFSNGKISSNLLKSYSINETNYWYEIDERRMIATNVYVLKARSAGSKDGVNVEIEFTGDVSDGSKLFGTMIIKYPENYEEQYSIEAVAEN